MKFYDNRFDFLFSSKLEESIEDLEENVVDGSTAYDVATGDFYIYYKNEWYKQGEEEGNDFKLIDVNTQLEVSNGDTIRVTDLGIDYAIDLYSDNEISADTISCSSSDSTVTTIEYIPINEDTLIGEFMLYPDNDGNCTVTLTIGTKTFTFNIEVAIVN